MAQQRRTSAKLVAALLAGGAIIVGAALLTRGPSEDGAAVPSPTPTKMSPAATPAATVAVTPTGSPRPEPTVGVTVDGITVSVRPVMVPSERRYLVTGFDRVLVLDLAARTAAEVGQVRVDPAPPGGTSVALSESADGRVVLLTVQPTDGEGVVFLVRPEQGELQEILRGRVAGHARLAPDGENFAVARVSPDPAVNGIWLGTIAEGLTARLVAAEVPDFAGSPPVPLEVSADAGVLAAYITGGPGDFHLALIQTDGGEATFDHRTLTLVGGETRVVGPGSSIDGLREGGPLLVASSRDAFGGESVVYRTDPDGGARRDLYRPAPDTTIDRALWRPDRGAIAVVERGLVFPPGSELRILVLDEAGAVLHEARHRFLVDLWWSSDGSRLYAATGGDDSTGAVTDVLTGQQVMSYCVRGGDRPPCV